MCLAALGWFSNRIGDALRCGTITRQLATTTTTGIHDNPTTLEKYDNSMPENL